VEAPQHLAGLCIVSRNVSAHAKFRAAVSDNHLAVDDSGRSSDCVTKLTVHGERLPNGFAGRGIERNEASVERPDKHSVLPDCDASIDDVATSVGAPLGWDLRIV